MKEILWPSIIQEYQNHITSHNLRSKTDKQLQEENIGSCRTCNPSKGSPPTVFLTFFSVTSQNLLAQSYTSTVRDFTKYRISKYSSNRQMISILEVHGNSPIILKL